MSCRTKEKTTEVWKRIETDKKVLGWYEISNMGSIRHVMKTVTKTIRPIRKTRTNNSRNRSDNVIFHIGGEERNLAREVYTAFVGEIPEGMCVVHRNGMRSDNRAENLMLCDRRELGARYARMARSGKTVARVDGDGNIVEVYRNITDAAKKCYLNRAQATQRCNGNIIKDVLPDGTRLKWEDDVMEA